MSADRPSETFIWTWQYAMANARIMARLERARYQVHGYRTGDPNRPWGYSVKPAQPRRA